MSLLLAPGRAPMAGAASPALPAGGVGAFGACPNALPLTNSAAASHANGYLIIVTPDKRLLGSDLGAFQAGRVLGQRHSPRRITILLQDIGGDGIVVVRLQ